MKAILIRTKNTAATEFYYDIIAEGLKKSCEVIFDGFEGEPVPKEKMPLLFVEAAQK